MKFKEGCCYFCFRWMWTDFSESNYIWSHIDPDSRSLMSSQYQNWSSTIELILLIDWLLIFIKFQVAISWRVNNIYALWNWWWWSVHVSLSFNSNIFVAKGFDFHYPFNDVGKYVWQLFTCMVSQKFSLNCNVIYPLQWFAFGPCTTRARCISNQCQSEMCCYFPICRNSKYEEAGWFFSIGHDTKFSLNYIVVWEIQPVEKVHE